MIVSQFVHDLARGFLVISREYFDDSLMGVGVTDAGPRPHPGIRVGVADLSAPTSAIGMPDVMLLPIGGLPEPVALSADGDLAELDEPFLECRWP